MAFYFLDTSAVVKRYVAETGTPWVQALALSSAAQTLFVAEITLVEVISAVTRRERGGFLSASDATVALDDFRHDFDQQYQVVGLNSGIILDAAVLARAHALRAYDAMQLAAAFEVHSRIPSLRLVSADLALNAAALAEGMAVVDPDSHP